MDPTRFYTRIEIKAVDIAQRIIQGHAAAFSNTDRTGDAIQPGAFDRTLKESNGDVLVFVGHDASKLPVGEPVEIRSDTKGLYTQTRIYETADGDALLEVAKQRLKSGKTLGMSIGYRTVKERWAGKVRQLLDVDLVEYSFLASPALAANPEATVVGTKGRRTRKATGIGQVITTEDSYEDLRDDLQAAAAVLLERSYVSVCATFSDHVIVSCYGNDDETHYWDIPYILDADNEPTLGEPSEVDPAFVPAEAKARGIESKPYRIEKRGSQFCVVGPRGKTMGCHSTRGKAQAQQRALYASEGKEKSLVNMTVEQKAALPDPAFAYIEQGGTKDDGGLTTPRTKRHFAHHDADGHVDETLLRAALADAQTSDLGSKALAHLERHARALGIGAELKADDAHAPEWSEGAAPAIMLIALKLFELAENVAADRLAMERIGIETKSGARLKAEAQDRFEELIRDQQGILNWAHSVQEGEDSKARTDWYRSRLALLELEVPA